MFFSFQKIEAFENRLFTHPLHKDPKLQELYTAYEKKAKLGTEIKVVKAELKKKRSLLQMDELKCRKRVLRRLGYANASDVIELKGRVACEISRWVFSAVFPCLGGGRGVWGIIFYVFNILKVCKKLWILLQGQESNFFTHLSWTCLKLHI